MKPLAPEASGWNVGMYTDNIVLENEDTPEECVRCLDCVHFLKPGYNNGGVHTAGKYAGRCDTFRKSIRFGETRKPRRCSRFEPAPVGTEADADNERKRHAHE